MITYNCYISYFALRKLTIMKNILNVTYKSSEPIYKQIIKSIKKKISAKEWKEGDKIPSEEEMVAELEVSRGTVRKAISVLVEDGILEKIQGKGTYIAKATISYPFAQELVSFAESMDQKHLNFATKVLVCEKVKPTPFLQDQLNIGENSPVLYLQRVRTVDTVPAILSNNWVSLERCPNLENIDYTKITLFDAIEESMGEKISYGTRDFLASKITPAQSKLMDLKVDDPILDMKQRTFNKQDDPLEVSDIYLRTDQYRVTSVLYR